MKTPGFYADSLHAAMEILADFPVCCVYNPKVFFSFFFFLVFVF